MRFKPGDRVIYTGGGRPYTPNMVGKKGVVLRYKMVSEKTPYICVQFDSPSSDHGPNFGWLEVNFEKDIQYSEDWI